MRKINNFSIKDLQSIAEKIKSDIFEPALDFKITVFLIGKDMNDKSSMRYKIAEKLTDNYWYSRIFELIYPEDYFDELLYGPNQSDLLSLENLLADSVDSIIVIPESEGSIAELGAFANNEKLRNKMVCVLDKKYKRVKSFINQGPIKLVKSVNKDAIIYIDYNSFGKSIENEIKSFSNFTRELEKLVSVLRKMKKNSIKIENKITLLQLDRYILPAIYLLEPVNKSVLIQIARFAMNDEINYESSTITALTILTKKRFIEATPKGYILTRLGKDDFFKFRNRNNRDKQHEKTIGIDDLRLEILNLKYRNKKLKV